MTDNADHESQLAARFAALASRDDGDWLDVRRRARRTRLRHALLVFAVSLAAVALAAPALGLHRDVIDWFQADPAPERTQLQFVQLGVGAPPGMEPGVIPNSARKVTTVRLSNGVHTLWVAPTKSGGFCLMWTDFAGGCTRERVPPIARPSLRADLNSFLLGATLEVDEEGTTKVVGGRLLGDAVERLRVEYEDGERAEIPFVWVSPPIDAGFYLFEVPKPHRQHGHRVTALVASDRDGEVVARQTIAFPRPEDIQHPQRLPDGQIAHLPANALIEKARRLIDFRAENGNRITLWQIPRAHGLPCHAFNRGGGCPPRPFDQAITGGLSGGGRPVLFQAQVSDEVAQVELQYEDGTVDRLEPVEGFVLTEVGSAHYERGHRLVSAVARGPGDEVIERQSFHADSPGVYPCEKPVDIGHGVISCP